MLPTIWLPITAAINSIALLSRWKPDNARVQIAKARTHIYIYVNTDSFADWICTKKQKKKLKQEQKQQRDDDVVCMQKAVAATTNIQG